MGQWVVYGHWQNGARCACRPAYIMTRRKTTATNLMYNSSHGAEWSGWVPEWSGGCQMGQSECQVGPERVPILAEHLARLCDGVT